MTQQDVQILDADSTHLDAMRAIYNDVLASSTAIFSDVERSKAEQERWFADRCAQGWPVIVAWDGTAVLGYATYGSFRSWPGYRHTVENSVYVAHAARGRGIGRLLLQTLIERARSQSLHAVIAGIDGDNAASMRLHETVGFKKVGHLRQVGRKFDRWLDLVFYERVLDGTGENADT